MSAAERQARWRARHPDYEKGAVERRKAREPEYRRLQRYGLDTEQYLAMLERQGNKCAICPRTFAEGEKNDVDHCHVTSVVRGILCPRCNRGLGHFSDDPELLRRAADYLEGAR